MTRGGPFVLAIDQGTTSSRVLVFNADARIVGAAQEEFTQHYPRPGWVEHDPEEIWSSIARLIPRALEKAGVRGSELAAIGITNQRETTLLWDRATGRPIGRAIVWQDRRTSEFCARRKSDEPWIADATGLVLDPYFSATKIAWLLEHDALGRPESSMAFGTIDSFLLWRLTGGASHVTDVTNASRTLLLGLKSAEWDEELCRFFGVPRGLLPEVRPSCGPFGATRGLDGVPDGIPITGIAGDQQASLFGQGCFETGSAKCTYGTGAFLLFHTGTLPIRSRSRLLTTIASSTDASLRYALEGSLFIAGAGIQWLRDGLGILKSASDTDELARNASEDGSLVFVPALVGLGAPHWVPQAQGAILGITRGTTAADLARATLDGIALQVRDLADAVRDDVSGGLARLRVDGGAARSDLLLQMQADVLGVPVERVAESESTALGAALLAGLGVGVWRSVDELAHVVRIERTFTPSIDEEQRTRRVERWRRAVRSVIGHHE
ncbi:MAG: glycerol kinase GlpK [Planctomycetes bacterium]|nr:glycerol kinase GlpK [Planctomycetota bacterium]